MILATTSVLAWRLLGAFTYMMDDLTQFDVANRTGLSSELLVMNVAQHFGPLTGVYRGFLVVSPMVSDEVIQANGERLQNAMYVTVPGLIAHSRWKGRRVGRGGARQDVPAGVRRPASRLGVPADHRHGRGRQRLHRRPRARYRSAHQFWRVCGMRRAAGPTPR